MSTGWALEVSRTDFSQTALHDVDVPEPQDGEVVLRVDRVGMTANNVTYAVLGESFRYWEFFPATDPSWGRVPLWGFCEVAASRAPGVEPGQRLYGYLPTASHLVVRPERIDARGFRDATPHRTSLPSPYNAYALTSGDPAYEAEREDLQVLYRPLFFTSFMLADFLADGGLAGAGTVALSSASSKTAYGAAFLLQAAGVRTVGLTSPGNVEFTSSLGCYDEVLPYDEVAALPAVPTAYVDCAGSTPLRQALHDHLGDALVLDLVVGVTHQDSSPAGALAGVRPSVFFAPDQMRKRTADWGHEGLDERFAQAWRSFVPSVERWVNVTLGQGPQALRDVWLEMLSGRSAPRTGHVLQLLA
jgi:NADPH:quinone reductase-like Zn-dependent oxidoreductase